MGSNTINNPIFSVALSAFSPSSPHFLLFFGFFYLFLKYFFHFKWVKNSLVLARQSLPLNHSAIKPA